MTAEEMLEYISQTEKSQINDLLLAVVGRYRELFPEWEICLFSIPKQDGEERERQLLQAMDLIREHKL